MLLDDDVLIDAGTGVGDLTLDEMLRIDHVFVTHSHLDHVCSIPFLVDTVGYRRDTPLTVYATRETVDALRAHVFNNCIWPDFTMLPRPEAPYLQFREINQGETVTLAGRKITALSADHLVPAVGYWLDSGAASLVFTGDTGPNDALWEIVNRIGNLRYLIIETAFCNRDQVIAMASRHLCPSLLAEEIGKLRLPAEIFITHLKPGDRALALSEVAEALGAHRAKALEHGQVIEF
ncbi:MAG: 3',5'-cyclic-nucleotide phosphodiesterase [Polaromonas sp.]|uniref:3',5'-cyclic-nucleotide phosphodiesterase n=1 Tax=Polaromonas sp. TaxID=1869339 RepID=UPI0027323207|nr:3',5'-cyclic-nucleotide phosphodiesterase [Polaromonas sp.]MDP3796181.1 3',5'-cyclic-nucleotide phosphodiesterase [Polaromonas sp.]